MNKLTLLQINIIGIVGALVLALVLWLALIKPKNDAIGVTKASITSIEGAGGTDDQVQKHEADLKKAKADAVRTQKDWDVNSVRYMPGLPYSSKDDSGQLIPIYEGHDKSSNGFKDLPTIYGKWITNWYDAQEKYGVTRVPGTEFAIPAYPTDPNYVSTIKDSLTLPEAGRPWSVAVECKDFPAAMQHLKRFNSIEQHGMPVVNNVALSGQTPNLLLTYTLGLYIIPSSTPPAADNRIGESRVMGGGMGMGGMMPGGMGSMPGGMPGGPGGMMGQKMMGGGGGRMPSMGSMGGATPPAGGDTKKGGAGAD